MKKRHFLGILGAGGLLGFVPLALAAGLWDSDAPGKRYDAQGRYVGKTDASGRRYDAQGRYVGKTGKK